MNSRNVKNDEKISDKKKKVEQVRRRVIEWSTRERERKLQSFKNSRKPQEIQKENRKVTKPEATELQKLLDKFLNKRRELDICIELIKKQIENDK